MVNSTAAPLMGLPYWSSARTAGSDGTGVLTGACWSTSVTGVSRDNGPGFAVAVKVTAAMPSAVACSVCWPEVVPSVHPPDDASPLAVVRTESLMTLPPPLAMRQRTRIFLMPFPLASVTRTAGTAATVAATAADMVVLAVAVAALGTWGSLPQPTSTPSAPTSRTAWRLENVIRETGRRIGGRRS